MTIGQLYAMAGNLADAEDAAAEAYSRAWQRWPKLSGYGDPEGRVRTVLCALVVPIAARRVIMHSPMITNGGVLDTLRA